MNFDGDGAHVVYGVRPIRQTQSQEELQSYGEGELKYLDDTGLCEERAGGREAWR